MSRRGLITKSYPLLLSQLKKVFIESLQRIEEEKVKAYWRTGQLVSDYLLENKTRAEYGESLFIKLSRDLDIDRSTLLRSVQFYRAFPIVATWRQLTWSHYRHLIAIKDEDKRELFIERAVKKEWDCRQLADAIRLDKLKIEKPKQKPAQSAYKLTVTRSCLFTYRILEPSYINSTDENVVVDVGFYINTEVALKGIARPKQGQIVESNKTALSYTFKTSDAKNKELYTYKAQVERVVDGDTIWTNIDCGFGIWIRQKLRLRGIDTAEIDTAKGKQAKQFVEAALSKVSFVVIKTHGSDKYDRYLADIFYLAGEEEPQAVLGQGAFLNQELLDLGLAQPM
ncbi:MAG: DUF1016 N-terminal domain-containing protein [Candidatus Omnitrophica bacterium]|nr:DUF1016 N-terminal domain-containing protein [Candidatus Omnitrophota bacterium]